MNTIPNIKNTPSVESLLADIKDNIGKSWTNEQRSHFLAEVALMVLPSRQVNEVR